jgi:hypothetical protein
MKPRKLAAQVSPMTAPTRMKRMRLMVRLLAAGAVGAAGRGR